MNGELFSSEQPTEQPATGVTVTAGHARCKRCRRPLKNPIARQLGYGKVCAGFMGIAFGAPSLPKVSAANDPGPELIKAAEKAGIEIGKTYRVDHHRKGVFTLKVKDINGEWITGDIIEGQTKTLIPDNSEGPGDQTTVRGSLCTFTELSS